MPTGRRSAVTAVVCLAVGPAPNLPVYAADQATLLATTDRWLHCDDGSG